MSALLDVSTPPRTTPTGLLSGTRATWQRHYALLLLALDLVGLAVITALGVLARFGLASEVNGLPYSAVAAGITLVWLLTLAGARSYESGFILGQTNEYLRVLRTAAAAFAAVSLLSFLTMSDVSRLYLGMVFPIGTIVLLANRLLAHRILARARAAGRAQQTVVVVGEPADCVELSRVLNSERLQSYRVVAACLPQNASAAGDLGIPVSVGLDTVRGTVLTLDADTVAVSSLDPAELSRLCYDLEGMGVEVLVAPSLAEVVGTRISIRPVAGLPLVHVDEPELDGVHKVVKSAFDRTAVLLGLLAISPALLVLWALVRFTSEGPAIFKQDRVGRDGQIFRVWKFRSMYPDAEARLAELQHLNEGGGPLFKMKNDPRITPIGRFIRKWSLDELPQLVNVLKGDMSLVGPRPPLPSEVAQYEGHAHRRLLVKPGITGLWQVSGRSDLDWDQTVRLDLSYVDGWSLGLDLSILARTALAVVRSSGAY